MAACMTVKLHTVSLRNVFVGCIFTGSSVEVLRHKLTCEHSNVQLDATSQQVLFTIYS